MTDFVTPRINANLRQSMLSSGAEAVRIIGKVESVDGRTAVLDCSGEVNVDTSNTSLEVGRYYEIVGSINPDLSIKMLSHADFGTNIDMKNVDRLIDLEQKHKEIFYTD